MATDSTPTDCTHWLHPRTASPDCTPAVPLRQLFHCQVQQLASKYLIRCDVLTIRTKLSPCACHVLTIRTSTHHVHVMQGLRDPDNAHQFATPLAIVLPGAVSEEWGDEGACSTCDCFQPTHKPIPTTSPARTVTQSLSLSC